MFASKFHCITTDCNLNKNSYQEIVAEALNFTCPGCRQKLIKSVIENWNNKISENDKFWSLKSFDDYPTIIAHEYWRLYDLIDKNKIYGALMQFKDVFEIILKYPILVLSSIYYHNNTRPEYQNNILYSLMEKQLSLGSWNKIGEILNISNKKELSVFYEILEKTLKLYSSLDVVNWRNNTLGHGALGFEEDIELKTDFEKKLCRLKKYFDECYDLYQKAELILTVGTDEYILKGKSILEKTYFTNAKLFTKNGDELIELTPYFVAIQNKLFLYDSYKSWTEYSIYLNYTFGKKHKDKIPEIKQLHDNLEKNTN